jgi:rod shape-determining protein MreD
MIFLVFFQIVILNNIQLGGYINPYFYVLFILLLPFETPKWLLLISAFILGLSVDMFSDTMGLHAAASVFMAYCRPGVLKIVSSRRDYEPGIQPIIRDLGLKWFFYYSLILVSVHHVILFYLEIFGFSEFFHTLLRAILSIMFTMLLLILSQYVMYRPKK